MDLYCKRCGEPWDNDEFHYVAEERGTTYKFVASDFRANGCSAVTGKQCEQAKDSARDKSFGLTRGEAASALYDLLGDDMDGAAAMLDDLSF